MTEKAATSAQTLAALISKSATQRGAIRRAFLQQGPQDKPTPGPLAALVRARAERALDAFLLVRTIANGGPVPKRKIAGFEVTQPAPVWARALSLEGTAGQVALSRAWAKLQSLKLIRRSRNGRHTRITALREDGSGKRYSPPGLKEGDVYLQLPVEYWYQEWHLRLSLAAKAMLLICLSLQDGFRLPSERVAKWYGVSADTAKRGLKELCQSDALGFTNEVQIAPLAPLGFTSVRRYTLKAPFRRVRATQKRAKTVAPKRTAGSRPKTSTGALK